VLVPTERDGSAGDGTVEAFGAVDDAAQFIEGSDGRLLVEIWWLGSSDQQPDGVSIELRVTAPLIDLTWSLQ
jgi:hypothetical protein